MKQSPHNRNGISLACCAFLFLSSLSWAGNEDLINKGKYLATASDCVACHTATNGQYFAGGLSFDTPFGTIFSPNITPDNEYGIGKYSSDQFYASLNRGIRGDGARLYPAMPYTSFHYITREDSDAMYAYFMSIRPVSHKNTKNDLSFPFNIRSVLIFWNLLFLNTDAFDINEKESEQWNRGKYLVEGPGHCGECHTPRNKIFFAMEEDKDLQGFLLGNLVAPNITENVLISKGWTEESLINFFKYGSSKKGSAFGPMSEVVFHSTQHLTKSDISAMSYYLLNSRIMTPDAPENVAAVDMGDSENTEGQSIYFANCAGCHGNTGQGIQHVAPPLMGNATVSSNNPHNLVTVVLNGVPTHRYSSVNAFYAMPDFKGVLSNQQITELVNFLRTSWSGVTPPVTTEEVESIRKKVTKNAAH